MVRSRRTFDYQPTAMADLFRKAIREGTFVPVSPNPGERDIVEIESGDNTITIASHNEKRIQVNYNQKDTKQN